MSCVQICWIHVVPHLGYVQTKTSLATGTIFFAVLKSNSETLLDFDSHTRLQMYAYLTNSGLKIGGQISPSIIACLGCPSGWKTHASFCSTGVHGGLSAETEGSSVSSTVSRRRSFGIWGIVELSAIVRF